MNSPLTHLNPLAIGDSGRRTSPNKGVAGSVSSGLTTHNIHGNLAYATSLPQH
ncbi:hypothetical protein AB0758_48515 [Tolypothrix bouteillei VB521301_2]|uniref:hypothetical protein n=1 Tax=Tolypothrix bouteillei TaxID=1246981 RepID=UPI0038B53EDD